MARYIDAVECAEIISEKCNIPLGDLVDVFAEIPTADVVPKSEVEALQGALKAEERHNELTMEMAQKALANAKAEVAREIFEEIYETMNSVYASVQRSCVGMHGDNPETMRLLGKLEGVKRLGDEIAELKKKYTEGDI